MAYNPFVYSEFFKIKDDNFSTTFPTFFRESPSFPGQQPQFALTKITEFLKTTTRTLIQHAQAVERDQRYFENEVNHAKMLDAVVNFQLAGILVALTHAKAQITVKELTQSIGACEYYINTISQKATGTLFKTLEPSDQQAKDVQEGKRHEHKKNLDQTNQQIKLLNEKFKKYSTKISESLHITASLEPQIISIFRGIILIQQSLKMLMETELLYSEHTLTIPGLPTGLHHTRGLIYSARLASGQPTTLLTLPDLISNIFNVPNPIVKKDEINYKGRSLLQNNFTADIQKFKTAIVANTPVTFKLEFFAYYLNLILFSATVNSFDPRKDCFLGLPIDQWKAQLHFISPAVDYFFSAETDPNYSHPPQIGLPITKRNAVSFLIETFCYPPLMKSELPQHYGVISTSEQRKVEKKIIAARTAAAPAPAPAAAATSAAVDEDQDNVLSPRLSVSSFSSDGWDN